MNLRAQKERKESCRKEKNHRLLAMAPAIGETSQRRTQDGGTVGKENLSHGGARLRPYFFQPRGEERPDTQTKSRKRVRSGVGPLGSFLEPEVIRRGVPTSAR